CLLSRLRRKASAGGQLEHPSDVKSSTKTGMAAFEAAEPAGTAASRNPMASDARRGFRVIQAFEAYATAPRLSMATYEKFATPLLAGRVQVLSSVCGIAGLLHPK